MSAAVHKKTSRKPSLNTYSAKEGKTLRLFAEKGKKDAISPIHPRQIAYRAHHTLPAFGCQFSCKLPFLVTQTQNRSYAILALQKLQDVYNIPMKPHA